MNDHAFSAELIKQIEKQNSRHAQSIAPLKAKEKSSRSNYEEMRISLLSKHEELLINMKGNILMHAYITYTYVLHSVTYDN